MGLDVQLGVTLESLGPGVVGVVCCGAEGYGGIGLRDLLLDLVHRIDSRARGLALWANDRWCNV